MSEPHTADLGTRYRYRLEGAQLERERIIEDFEAACRCEKNQADGHDCWADWAIKIVNEHWKKEQK